MFIAFAGTFRTTSYLESLILSRTFLFAMWTLLNSSLRGTKKFKTSQHPVPGEVLEGSSDKNWVLNLLPC
jgi:hypothetical protein